MRAGLFRAIDCMFVVIVFVLRVIVGMGIIMKPPLGGAGEWPGAGGILSCCLMICLTAAIVISPALSESVSESSVS